LRIDFFRPRTSIIDFPCGLSEMYQKAVEGLRPSFSAHVRLCEHGAPLQSGGVRERFEGQDCGIPHLAKNERGVGHPALVAGIEPKAHSMQNALE